MGCWDETCGLSGLPITCGTQTGLFIIVPGHDYHKSVGFARNEPMSPSGGFCYSTGMWRPVAPAVFGPYNDYGTIELKEQPAHWGMTEEHLQSFGVEATFHRRFFDRLERGKVVGKGLYGFDLPDNVFPVGQMLVRKDVLDFLLETPVRSWLGESSRAVGHKNARELVKHVLENPPKSERDGLGWAFELERTFREKPTPFFQALFGGGSEALAASYQVPLVYALTEKDIEPEAALRILDEIADLAYVNTMMQHLRRAWGPQTGKGSQDLCFDLHEKFALKVSDLAKREQIEDE